MPRIGEWLGIAFYVYADDHNPPHVHAIYGDQVALLEIATGRVYAGSLPGAKLRHAKAWLAENQAAALAAWERMNP
jgi:hypothetical protein